MSIGRYALPAVLFPLSLTIEAAASECDRLDDPLQVLDFHLTMAPGDWEIVRRDDTFSIERPAQFSCGDEASVPARVRRKFRPALPDDENPIKVSLKVDFDDDGGRWHGLNKLSLENGVGKGGLVTLKEGVSWQVMARAGVVSSGASWVRVHVNGRNLGVYTRVEEVDKRFLKRRVGEDGYFLYKVDYNFREGYRRLTRLGERDPYAEELCFPPFARECDPPADGFASLGERLDLRQFFTLAAANAILGNFDSLLFNVNNFYWYNSPRPRLVIPWDLDLLMWEDYLNDDPHLPPNSSEYQRLLFADEALRREFDGILLRLIEDACRPEVIGGWLDEVARAVGPAIDADPWGAVEGGAAAEIERIRSWFQRRDRVLRRWLPAPRPHPLVINEVLASNGGINADEGGERAGWVELYNRGAGPVPLGELFLSDEPARPRKWQLPDIALPAGGHVLIWCDRDRSEGPLHSSFEIDAEGGSIGLYETGGIDGAIDRTIDFVWFRPQETDVAIGRVPDGAPGFRSLVCPTPAKPNRGDCAGPERRFARGDANGDGGLDVSDAINLLGGLFLGEPVACFDAGDADDGGSADIADAIAILLHLFLGGPQPAAPFPMCGVDPTADALECREAAPCGE